MKNGLRCMALLLLLLLFLPSLSLFTLPAFAAEAPELTAVRAAVLYNVENDCVLYSLHADEAVYPASSVKLMTAVLAYRALSDRMQETITITQRMINGVQGYRTGFAEGEEVSIESLFYAMLLRGSNDAAYALACLTADTVSAFVDRMNAYAKELGMQDTFYLNPGGMHEPQMVTTVNDTLKIALEFAKEEELLAISSVVKYIIPENNKSDRRTIYNKNSVVSRFQETKYYYEYARGMNYGSTDESGVTCTSSASHNGLTYIAVVIGGEEDPVGGTDYAMTAVKKLLTYGVENFGYREVIALEKPVCEIPVTLSATTDFVLLYPKNGLTAYLPTDVDVDKEIRTSYRLSSENLAAPVEKGQTAGYLNIYYGDTQLGSVELITGDSVERNSFLYLLENVKEWSKGRFFRATCVAAVVFTVLYILISAYIRRRHSKRGRRYRF